MKIGVVVQRYGLDISGGAELHARLIAEYLSQKHEVTVYTTCARDYVYWKNTFRPGCEKINHVTVHRFRVSRTRNIRKFVQVQNLVFPGDQDVSYEEDWITENGPVCPALIEAVSRDSKSHVYLLFSYRYWTTVHALRVLKNRAVLIPTAENDPAIRLRVFQPIFNMPRMIFYNTPEEKNLINSVSGNHSVVSDIVGVGLTEVSENEIERFERKYDLMAPYIIYVGRIDKNKGCDHLFRLFRKYCDQVENPLKLHLIGHSELEIPGHPHIVYLGKVSEAEKLAAIKKSRALVMPSPYESLSMVVLESWKMKRPVLVNEQCEVLLGQCIRSNGGLSYRNFDEFSELLNFIRNKPVLADQLGEQGHAYYSKNYTWDVIGSKIDTMLAPFDRKS